MQQKPDFKRAFLALMKEESAADHPAAETLAAYRTGDLGGEERAIVHRHLALCRECAELARDLDLFTEAAEPGAADEFEIAASLRRLRPRLAKERSPPKAAWRSPLALAASFVLVAGASWWLSSAVTQRQILADFSQPRANVQIVDLIEDASRRTGGPPPHGEIRPDVGAVLILTPDVTEGFSSYDARILDSEGGLAYSVQGLELDPDSGTFSLLIPAESLALGDYAVELSGRLEDRGEVGASDRLRVVAPGGTESHQTSSVPESDRR